MKTHFFLGQSHQVSGDWFILHFTENPGMAFGLELGGDHGKLLLSVFRLLAVGAIGWYLWTLFKKNVRPMLTICVALIFAGAVGNILDSVFYGVIFSSSDYWGQVAEFMPADGGYAAVLHGQVVDMFYFPVWEGTFPDWFPYWGGEDFMFFRPVFNIADASISIGVFLLIIFQRRLFGEEGRLSDKKILRSNIFLAALCGMLALFLLLTYMGMFSETHPLSKITQILCLASSALIGYGMFRWLQRQPVFDPVLIMGETTETPVANSPTEPTVEATESADAPPTDLLP